MRSPLVAVLLAPVLLAAVALPGPALGQAGSIEDRLRALEERVAQLEAGKRFAWTVRAFDGTPTSSSGNDDPIGGRDDDASRTWTSGLAWLIGGQDLELQAAWMHVSGSPPDGVEDKGIVRFQLAF